LSSTTERRSEQAGQILILFAGGLVAILLVAALVFDVGQNLLDRRTEQNVSDAAALAGARYVVGATYTYHGACTAVTASTKAPYEACQSAASNGYVDGANNITVRVDMPPIAPSAFSGLPGYIEVTIGSTRPSFFEGVIGIFQQRVGAMGVATNASDIALPYSLLALASGPTACGVNMITGSPGSAVSTNGTVHIDSSCPSDALLLSGNGVLDAPECDVVGVIHTTNNAHNYCDSAPAGVLVSGDPLRNLQAPAQPGAPAAVRPLDGGPIPAGCPGSTTPATDAVPATCAFTAGPVAGHTYRIFPGSYPGGISTSKATLYMDPGIYWIGGGGVHIQSSGVLVSKAAGDNTGSTPSGGVLIYNTADPNPTIVSGCASGSTGAGCYDDIVLNGGGGSTPTLALLPIQSGLYENMVIFADRTKSKPDDIMLNGSNSSLSISGTIYAANGTVKLNGGATTVVSAQVICWSFQVNGSAASFTIDYDGSKLFHLKGVGLVE
jgi:hypothetical protein